MDVPRHEFYINGSRKNPRTYRVALGELIPGHQRKVFPTKCEDGTGSIGFIDLQQGPKSFFDPCTSQSQQRNVLWISRIGIEPGSQKQGYGPKLIERAEEICIDRGLYALVTEEIGSKHLAMILKRRGHQLFFPQTALKILNPYSNQ